MGFLEKTTAILFVGFLIYFWNKYIVKNLIHNVVKKNSNNKWLQNNKKIITKSFQSFYWAGFIMYLLSMVIS